ncbi:MAG: DNA repair protein RecN [Ruminococcaceae bacterium]|nr:DNA repair protein RecN [Oscillospiraceae bacterium]
MLDSLYIKNVALIKELNIEFDKGFTVFTGETGAGKSIIIDSIGMLLGKNVSKDMIRSGEEDASVSGIISDIDDEKKLFLNGLGVTPDSENIIYIQKDISKSTRSSTRLNSRPIPSSLQKEIAPVFINIHGQNEGQELFKSKNQINILDSFVDRSDLFKKYSELYKEMREIEKLLADLKEDDSEKLRRADMLRFQAEDIKSAKLRAGESNELEESKKRLLANEKIRKYSSLAYRAIYNNEKGMSATDMLSKAASAIDFLTSYFPSLQGCDEKLNGIISELTDIAERVKETMPEYEDDPTAMLDRIEARLDRIEKLKRKYGADEESIIAYLKSITDELESMENSAVLIEEYTAKVATIQKEAFAVAQKIHALRVERAKDISVKICDVLNFLDMPKVKFEIAVHNTGTLTHTGCDEVEFMISPNPGEPLLPMEKIASGGELSRIMLAVKSVLAEKDRVPTLIFDEIDTGISGKTSRKIGIKLKELSKHAQIICITHSAQIASLADTHFKISKTEINGRTETTLKNLSLDERVDEVARILGGIEITETQRRTALELIKGAQ